MKKEFQKKILSILLSISMIASQMGTAVFAADELSEDTYDQTEISVSETEEIVTEDPDQPEISDSEEEIVDESVSDTPESSEQETEDVLSEEEGDALPAEEILEETEEEFVSVEAMDSSSKVAVASEIGMTSGTCGENLTWTLSEDGVLTISGEGKWCIQMGNIGHIKHHGICTRPKSKK